MNPSWLERLLFGQDPRKWSRLAHAATGYRYFAKANPDISKWTLEDHAATGWKHYRYPMPDVLPVKPWHPDRDAAFTSAPTRLHPRSDAFLAHMRAAMPAYGGIRIETGTTVPNYQGKVEGYVTNLSRETDPEFTVIAPTLAGPGGRDVMVWDGANWPTAPFGAKVRIDTGRMRLQGYPMQNYSDRKGNFLDPQARTLTEIQHVEVQRSGGIRCHGLKQIDLARPSTEARGTSAAGQPVSELQLRYDDIIRDGWVQRTTMAVVAQAGSAVEFLAPAEGTDGKSTHRDSVPFGAVLRVKPETVKRLLAKGCGPQTKAVLRCLDLGVMVVDTAGHNFLAFEPHPKWDQADLADIRGLTLDDFAVWSY